MNFPKTQPTAGTGHRATRGFALVATLSLMLLLLVLAIGLLSLSSISLRTSSASKEQQAARANARLSLQLALGQLQSLAGQDTRITAPRTPEDLAAPLDSLTPATGVWRSWEGTDHDNNGRPIAPDYASKKTAGDPAALPGTSGSDGRFLGWLTSAGAWDAPDPKNLPDLISTPTEGYVPLIADGSVKEPKRRVFVKPTALNDKAGAIAWWTSGENSKAHIAPDSKPPESSLTGWQQRSRAHATPSPKDFGFTAPPASSAVSTGTLELMAADRSAAKGNFHDLTVWSSGLLTNAATGGWKRDLSLMTEKWDELPATKLPFFTLRPGENLRFSKAAPPQTSPGSHPDKPLLYPWAQYSAAPSEIASTQIPPIVSWDYLRNACVQYRSLIPLGASQGRVGMPWALNSFWTSGTKSYRYEFLDQPRRWPALSRTYFMFSYASVPDAAKPENLKAALVMSPVVVIWNPYNVGITIEATKRMYINMPHEISPAKFRFTVGAQSYPAISFLEAFPKVKTANNKLVDINNFDMRLLGGSITLNPGETRVFSVKDDTLVPPSNSGVVHVVELYPGYRTFGGVILTTIGPNKTEISAPKDSPFKVDMTFDTLTKLNNRSGYGSILETGYEIPGGNSLDNGFSRRTSRQYLMFSEQAAKGLWQPIAADNLPSTTLSAVQGNQKNRLFLTAVVGFRTANDSLAPGNGYLQANPLNYFNDLSDFNDLGVSGDLGAGLQHPSNSSYDIQFINGADLSARPNAEPATNRGYIISGLDASSGLTQSVVAEIPTRPIQSLCDLQHFDLRNANPVPPFQFNIFGNSEAAPLLPQDAVVRPDSGDTKRLQHDDAYCLNHAFFDDWFVSSIAPAIKDWSNQTDRNLETVYKDFLAHTKDTKTGTPLPNAMLRPTLEAIQPDAGKAYDRDVKPADSYRHIASKLTVEGMFNINSTSIKAWQALLGHALGQRQPYLADSGGTWQAKLAPARDHVVSRMSVAGAGAAGLDTPPAGSVASALEFSGHRALTDKQIKALAEEIVTQIRRRGPFLSLSEFINRRLSTASSEKDLALAGTVQAALAALAARGSDPTNPYREIQQNSEQITQATVANMPAAAEAKYLFPEAAEGWSSYGVPGWIRQADILRPLAPVLSVRDDTFVIRAYGDARDKQNKITASAWCEATVQRTAAFSDPSDAETDIPVIGTDSGADQFLQSEINARYGRSFRVLSFRWLNPDEI